MLQSRTRLYISLFTALLATHSLAQFACPADSAEYGTHLLEESANQPGLFTQVSRATPITSANQLSAIFYCTVQNSRFLAGFKMTFGAGIQQEYGDLATVQASETGVDCTTILVNEWVRTIQYFWESDSGLLGFTMVGDGGTEFRVRALGTGAVSQSPIVELTGPPVGFNVLFGEAVGRSDTPQAMQAVVNECACDFSYYLGDQGPRNMNTDSVSGVPDVQVMPNQDNFITLVYGQDCGKTVLALSPDYPFLTYSSDIVTAVHTLTVESLTNQIGSYDVTATLSNEDPFSLITPVVYDFKIFIHPCTLEDLVIMPPDSVSFYIGSAETELAYTVSQVPNCQYPIEVFFTTNLPTYMEHDVDAEKIIFPQTDDVGYAGFYSADMGVRVYIPDDYTYDNILITTFKEPFTLEIIDPCPETEIVNFALLDQQVRVFAEVTEQALVTPEDTVSQQYGADGTTFCGPRLYQFLVPTLPASTVVTFDEATNTIYFESSDLLEVGTHIVQVTVALAKYNQIRSATTFELEILPCLVTSFEPVAFPDSVYNVFEVAKILALEPFVQTPACAYSVDYSFDLLGPQAGALPGFIAASGDTELTIQTDDITDVEVYIVRLSGTVPESLGATVPRTLTTQTTFNLNVMNGCLEDVILPSTYGVADTTTYRVGDDTTISLVLAWTQDKEGCPIEFSFLTTDQATGAERDLSAQEQAVLTIQADSTTRQASIQISQSSFNLLGTLPLIIRLSSKHSEQAIGDYSVPVDPSVSVPSGTDLAQSQSGRYGSYSLTVELVDMCWMSDLQAAEFTFSSKEYDLYELQELPYEPMEDLTYGLQCGGYTHELEYVSGPAPTAARQDLSTVFTDLGSNEYRALIDSFEWVGTHTLRIRSTNGRENNVATRSRGVNGLFNTVTSQTIDLTINDPCEESRVSQVPIGSLYVPQRQTSLSREYDGPSDSASLTYGTGYDKCGQLAYAVVDSQGNEVNTLWLDVRTFVYQSQVDEIYITVLSEPEGRETTQSLYLRAELVQYPQAEAALIPFSVTYRGCWFQTFTPAVVVAQKTVLVGASSPLEVPFSFDQAPCSYNQEVTVTVRESKSGTLVEDAAFISLDADSGMVMVQAFLEEQAGRYLVTIEGRLDNVIASTSQIEFTLNIVEDPDASIAITDLPEPTLELFVHTQRVQVGDSFDQVYEPTIRAYNAFGYLRELSIDFGLYEDQLSRFVQYDSQMNLLRLQGSKATRSDVGVYELIFNVALVSLDATYEESYSFNLIVRDTFRGIDGDDGKGDNDDPTNVIDEQTWDGKVLDNLAIAPFDKDAPIPVLESVSASGLVRIVWDRKMEEVEDLDRIVLSKVALRDYENHVGFGKGQGVVRGRQLVDLKIVDGLEVRIAPRDGDYDPTEKVSFTWDVQSFDQRVLELQLYIEDAELVSQAGQVDALFLTFYDTALFQAATSGTQVRYGTVLSQDLFRLVSPSQQETVDNLKFFYGLTIATLVVSAPMLAVGDLLPTWIFVNGLSLIAHTPLLNSAMPSNAQYFLTDYLKITRLRAPVYDEPAPLQVDQSLTEHQGRLLQEASDGVMTTSDLVSEMGGPGSLEYEGAYNARFLTNGYSQLMWTNLSVIAIIALVLTVLWALCELKDCLIARLTRQATAQEAASSSHQTRRKWYARRWGPPMANALVRLGYLFWLELCICTFLTVSHPRMESENAAGFQWITALVALIAIISVSVLLCLLCTKCTRVGKGDHGYQIPDFYSGKWTQSSDWRLRDINKPKYEPYSLHGKGSDEIWEEYMATRDEQKLDLLKPAVASTAKPQEKRPSLKLPLERLSKHQSPVQQPAHTTRNLLAEDPSPRDLTPTPHKLNDQLMMQIIQTNQTHARRNISDDSLNASINDDPRARGTLLGLEQNTADLNLDSLGSALEPDADQTINQVSLGDDSIFDNKPLGKKRGSSKKQRSGSKKSNKSSGKKKNAGPGSGRGANDFFEGGEAQQIDEENPTTTTANRPQIIVTKTSDRVPAHLTNEMGVGHEKDPLVDYKEKLTLYLRRLARKRQTLVDNETSTKQSRFSTLWKGLIKNHERNVALVHPVSFAMRRVVYALLITAFAAHMYTSVLVFMAMTLAVLGYALHENQWTHWLINQQHIVNEVFIYLLSVNLYCFSGFVGSFTASTLGWTFISLVCLFIVYNAIVIMRFALRTLYVITKTAYVRYLKKYVRRGSKADQDSESDSEKEDKKKKMVEGSCKAVQAGIGGLGHDIGVNQEPKEIREIQVQTDDYGGMLSRIWAWLQEKFFGEQNSNTNGGFFVNDANELSFGKRKEGDEEDANSCGTFGGRENDQESDNQLALKSLEANLIQKPDQRPNSPSPQRSDIFNKSGQNENENENATEEGLLQHQNIPIKVKYDEALDKSLEKQVTSGKKRRSTHGSLKESSAKKVKKRKAGKLTLKDGLLDPSRQVNLLEESGLSDAIEANLREASLGEIDPKMATLQNDAMKRLLDEAEALRDKKLASSTGFPNAAKSSGVGDKHFSDEQLEELATIPQNEADGQSQGSSFINSDDDNEAGSDLERNLDLDGDRDGVADSDGDGVADSDEDGDGNRDGDGDTSFYKPDDTIDLKDQKSKELAIKKTKSTRRKGKKKNTKTKVKEQQKAPKFVGQKTDMASTIQGSLNRKISRTKKSKKEQRSKSVMDTLSKDDTKREVRKRGSYMDGTQAGKDRLQARLSEVKPINLPPMRYTNQGKADKKDDGSRPMTKAEQEELESTLKAKHMRSMSESGFIRDSRLEASRLNEEDRKRRAQEGGQSSRNSQQNPRWNVSTRPNRFGRDDSSGVSGSRDQYGSRVISSNDSQVRDSRSILKQGSLNRSLSSQARVGGGTSLNKYKMGKRNQGGNVLNTIETMASKRNSSDGFKQTSGATTMKADMERHMSTEQQNRKDDSADQRQEAPEQDQQSIGQATTRNDATSMAVAPFRGATDDSNADLRAFLSGRKINETTLKTDDCVGDAKAQQDELDRAIDNVMGDQSVIEPVSQKHLSSHKNSQGFNGKNRPNSKLPKSILSDWDGDQDQEDPSVAGQGRASGAQNPKANYFYTKKPSRAFNAKKNSTPAPPLDLSKYDTLRRRYGLKEKEGNKSSRSKSFLSTAHKKDKSDNQRQGSEATGQTPGFEANGLTPNEGPEATQNDELLKDLTKEMDRSILAKSNTSMIGRNGGGRATGVGSHQHSKISKRSLSTLGQADMVVPINLDGDMISIMNSSALNRKSLVPHRNYNSNDFPMYANAFGKKFTEQFNSRQNAVNNAAQSSMMRGAKKNQDTYWPGMDESPNAPPQRITASGRQALDQFLNDVPLNEQSQFAPLRPSAGTQSVPPSSSPGGNRSLAKHATINFQLGGDGIMNLGGPGSVQSRMQNLKHSKLFSTVMDVRPEMDRSLHQAPASSQAAHDLGGPTSHTRSVMQGASGGPGGRSPYQSKQMTPYNKSAHPHHQSTMLPGRKAPSSLGSKHPKGRSIIPDETSEGNRKDLLQGMFFPGSVARNLSHSISRASCSSVRSISLGSNNGSVSRYKKQSTIGGNVPLGFGTSASRLSVVNLAAGQSIISGANGQGAGQATEHRCRNRRYCSVSSMDSNE